jgi:hypothetical protein
MNENTLFAQFYYAMPELLKTGSAIITVEHASLTEVKYFNARLDKWQFCTDSDFYLQDEHHVDMARIAKVVKRENGLADLHIEVLDYYGRMMTWEDFQKTLKDGKLVCGHLPVVILNNRKWGNEVCVPVKRNGYNRKWGNEVCVPVKCNECKTQK